MTSFEEEVASRVSANAKDPHLTGAAKAFMEASTLPKYCYNFSSLGRPIIQYPQDMVAIQELIWSIRPDLIIEAGIAHGGSLVMSAAALALIDYTEAVEKGGTLDPKASPRKVLGIDIDIRSHNREAIEKHPLAHKIHMIQGSSIDPSIIEQVHSFAANHERIMVILDSNHTHDHVLNELRAYAPLTSRHSYCVVFDTIIEDVPDTMYPDRPWSRGNNPKTAVWAYLEELKASPRTGNDRAPLSLEIDRSIQDRLLITVAADGYLRRT
jgi:cephalosporin hydroxylase